ncbi:hypothetical protein HMSSN036_31980 [Paenibacillus macerans]|nr:hypothetical protein HMSSN036_31980 [Paenibacillus macerans]
MMAQIKKQSSDRFMEDKYEKTSISMLLLILVLIVSACGSSKSNNNAQTSGSSSGAGGEKITLSLYSTASDGSSQEVLKR